MNNLLNVVSYNIWFDTYREIERITSLIINLRESDPDIICLQEVKQNTYKILIINLRKYKYYYPKVIPGNYGCVIFSKYPIKKGAIIKFKNSSMERHLVTAIIDMSHEILPLELIIANTHFESLFNGKNTKKIEQYHVVKEILDTLYKKHKNVIFCADTNILPREEKQFIGTDDDSWCDGWKIKGDDNNKYTFDGDNNIYLKLKYKKKYKSRLDRIIFQTDRYQLNEFDILKTLEEYVPPSDHFGIYGKFRIII